MKKAQPPSEDAYSLVVIRGFPNSPVLDASTAEGRTGTGTDALIWSDRESTHVSDFADLNTWPVPGFRILPDKPTDFAIATEGTDNFGWNVYAPDKPIAMFIDDLTNDQDQAENKEDQATEGYGNFLRRSIFAKGHKVGEAGPYIWFESEGTTYATDKTDWDLWMKGAHSSSTTKP